MIDRLAQAFAETVDNPDEVENTKAELLFAAGYNPAPTVARRKELVDVLEREAELAEERTVQAGQEIWIYSRMLLETDLTSVFETVYSNLLAGIRYSFFIHPDHASDCVTFRWKLKNRLERDGKGPDVYNEACEIIVIPPDAFMFADNRMCLIILAASDDSQLRCFKTRKQSSETIRFVELDRAEGIEYRDFLGDMIEREKRNRSNRATQIEPPPLPCRADYYAQYIHHNLSKTATPASRTTRLGTQ